MPATATKAKPPHPPRKRKGWVWVKRERPAALPRIEPVTGLRECPFCGEDGLEIHRRASASGRAPVGLAIQCVACGATGPSCPDGIKDRDAYLKLAWCQRARKRKEGGKC